jgi:hypothetical protein
MSATEHIVLESDAREVPDRRAARTVHTQIGLKSRLRRHALHLEIIDYYYLCVRSGRSRAPATEYVLDLRFVDANARVSRHFAWRSMMVALTLVAVAAAIAARPGRLGSWLWQHDGLAVCTGAIALAALAVFVCAYRTSETITLCSAHGKARLLEFTGSLGTLRAMRTFRAKLAAHTQAAAARRRASKAEHLRDEMREHFRLREVGVLSLVEYEAAKLRILGQHPQ